MEELRQQIRNTISEQEMPPYIYTYPTKKKYEPFTNWKRACESWSPVTGSVTLYIHIPLCKMKCTFCDMFTVVRQPDAVADRYVQAVLSEIEIMKPYLQTDRIAIQSIYFGGGTPSLLSERHLHSIVSKLHDTFSISGNVEWSIEGTPDSFSSEKFKQLKKLGFNRVSMGIQTFDDRELCAMGRIYGANLGSEMARNAIVSGIQNVNLDLIYGIPGQDFEKWKQNLLTAVDIEPTTITAYPLVVRTKTPLGRQVKNGIRKDCAEARSRYRWYDFTNEQLISNGYQQHTLVTYAKPGGGCQHEANEFVGAPTLAFGAGARKYAPDLHYVDEDYWHREPNKITLMKYMAQIEQGELLVRSAVQLTKNDQIMRHIILGLLASGIDTERYFQRFQEPIKDRFHNLFQALQAEGYLLQGEKTVRLSNKGRRFSSHIGHFIAHNIGGK